MKMINRKSIWIFLIIYILVSLCGCTESQKQDKADSLQIVTTIFPSYDFARSLTKSEADIKLLLKPGMESHTYEPSPGDILDIANCDIFIYNGGESDTWVDEILKITDTSSMKILKLMDCVEPLEEEEGTVAEGHDHGAEVHHGHGQDHDAYDEHVWTSPRNAIHIVTKLLELLIEADPPKEAFYRENYRSYRDELQVLDQTFQDIVSKGENKHIIFGDRFPFLYLAKEYGLTYEAAFPGCSAATEPSVKTVAHLIDHIREDDISVVFYAEMSNQKLVRALEDETGAKPRLFHSCHNLTMDEMERGETYLSLMRMNAENLKEALIKWN